MLKISVPKNQILKGELEIPSSKSISNRALIIQALSDENIELKNLSISDDTEILLDALNKKKIHNKSEHLVINVGLAGTAFRFLTAFFVSQKGYYLLNGNKRIQERPIKPLVDTLKELGAEIYYLDKDGFAPLMMKGKKLKGKEVIIDANISSQFITALLLIAPSIGNSFTIRLNKKITSRPYIEMTVSLMNHFGVKTSFKENTIQVSKGNYKGNSLFIEADWSSASYFYECLALAQDGEIVLKNYNQKSIQGDSKLAELFIPFGVETSFEKNQIRLKKTEKTIDFFEYDFSNEPDLAQTFIALCVGLGLEAKLSGLESLKIKETNRIAAMHNEIQKVAYQLIESDTKGFYLLQKMKNQIQKEIIFETYKDHRMAMSLAPLALKFDNIFMKNPEVVSKSNPLFWEQIDKLGFILKK